MKHNSKNLISLFCLIFFLFISPTHSANALHIVLGPTTYTNGSLSETFQLNCGDFKQLALGGNLTFEVVGIGSLVDIIDLDIETLPAGATFPRVIGIQSAHSTFTWTPPGTFSGTISFTLSGIPACSLTFDWPLPVELSSSHLLFMTIT